MKKLSQSKPQGIMDLIKGSQNTPYVEDYGSLKEYYLVEEIGAPEDYIDCFHDIRNSRDTDIIKIYINCTWYIFCLMRIV